MQVLTAHQLLAQQAAATAAWVKLAERFADDLNNLQFPLGFPVVGWDEYNLVEMARTDWMQFVDEKTLEDRAADVVAKSR